MKKLFMFISLLMAGIVLTTSCDSDNDYNVVLPVYSDVVFTYNGNQLAAGNIPVGKTISVTLAQQKEGSRIYRYDYAWSCPEVNELTPQLSSNNGTPPTNSFVAPEAGEYTLTIVVTYSYSGNGGANVPWPTYDIPGGTVTYSAAGDLYGKATITKTFVVR